MNIESTPLADAFSEDESSLALSPDQNRLFQTHLKIAEKAARAKSSRLPAHIEFDDVHQAALLGLTKACKKFDASKGFTFATYATHRVQGSIIDYLRDNSSMSRGQLQFSKLVERASSEILTQTLEKATLDTLAAKLCMDQAELRDKITEHEIAKSIDMALNAGSISSDGDDGVDAAFESAIDEGANPAADLDKAQRIAHFESFAQRLSEKERTLIRFLLDGEKMNTIAEAFGVSESRASQISSAMSLRIGKHMAKAFGDDIKAFYINPFQSPPDTKVELSPMMPMTNIASKLESRREAPATLATPKSMDVFASQGPSDNPDFIKVGPNTRWG